MVGMEMTAQKTIEHAIRHPVESGQLAGAAALVWRDGEVHETVTVGRRDLTSGRPVERDTIFRIASMTKPVTTVAALMLLDEGRFALDDPITTCAPEIAPRGRVAGPGRPARRPRRGTPIDHVPRFVDASIGADGRRVSSWTDLSGVRRRARGAARQTP